MIKILGLKENKGKGVGTKLKNKALHKLHTSPDIN
jgi:hypothetical protein